MQVQTPAANNSKQVLAPEAQSRADIEQVSADQSFNFHPDTKEGQENKKDNREQAHEISQVQKAQESQNLKPEEQKAIRVLNSTVNGARKIGSKALAALGVAGATMTAVLYFLFNSKIFSMISAIPTALLFFTSHSLKKSAKQSQGTLGITDDPHKILKKAYRNSLYLEENFEKVFEAMIKLKTSGVEKRQKSESIKSLHSLVQRLQAKKREIEKIDPQDLELHEIDRFLDYFKTNFPSEDEIEYKKDTQQLVN